MSNLDGFSKPYLVVRAMNGKDQESQRQSHDNDSRDHEGSMEENDPHAQTTVLVKSFFEKFNRALTKNDHCLKKI